jgi:hypothetical protein
MDVISHGRINFHGPTSCEFTSYARGDLISNKNSRKDWTRALLWRPGWLELRNLSEHDILLMNLFRTRFKTENFAIFMVCKTIFHAFWTRFMMIWKPQDLVDFMSWMKTPRGFAPPPTPQVLLSFERITKLVMKKVGPGRFTPDLICRKWWLEPELVIR